MGLNPFRDDPMIVLYKAASYLYPAFVAALLARPLLRASLECTGLSGSAMRLMAIGFMLVPVGSPGAPGRVGCSRLRDGR